MGAGDGAASADLSALPAVHELAAGLDAPHPLAVGAARRFRWIHAARLPIGEGRRETRVRDRRRASRHPRVSGDGGHGLVPIVHAQRTASV